MKVVEIASDGDCMYKAVEHQLATRHQCQSSVGQLRQATANQLKQHPDQYLPFLTSSSGDTLMNHEEFEKYCDQVEKTRSWGGNVELKALASHLNTEIQVIQADGPVIRIQPELGTKSVKPSLTLRYVFIHA